MKIKVFDNYVLAQISLLLYTNIYSINTFYQNISKCLLIELES